MAGAGGLALGAGAVFAAEHAGHLGARPRHDWLRSLRLEEVERKRRHEGCDIAQFAEGAFDDVGRFAGDAAHGVEEFVEDIF
ncbi:unnamed protein product [Symbiodinium necroappetens]|uniref:Uncharacterized protein n=1 Tax=Symbiodinium necroappetens TaxID=1628268 RepID=A0A812LL52_9DINO|nr:unnamed protein product [Symbiodinium necroappetens]